MIAGNFFANLKNGCFNRKELWSLIIHYIIARKMIDTKTGDMSLKSFKKNMHISKLKFASLYK